MNFKKFDLIDFDFIFRSCIIWCIAQSTSFWNTRVVCHLISSPIILFFFLRETGSPWKRHLLKCTTFHISREEFRPGIWPVCYPQTPHLLDPEVQAQGQCQPLGGWPTPCPTTQGHTGASQQRQFTIPTFYPKVNLLKGINNCLDAAWYVVKFIYSEKATKFCEIFSLLLSVCKGQ